MVLTASTLLTSTSSGNVKFAGTVDGAYSLTVDTSGTTEFDGAVGSTTALTSLTTDAGGTTDINGLTVTTTGAQTYHDAVVLTASALLLSLIHI